MSDKNSAASFSAPLALLLAGALSGPAFSAAPAAGLACPGQAALLRSPSSDKAAVLIERITDGKCAGDAALLRGAYKKTDDLALKLRLLSAIGVSGDMDYAGRVLDIAEERPETAEDEESGDDAAAREKQAMLAANVSPRLLLKLVAAPDPDTRARAASLWRRLAQAGMKDDGFSELVVLLSSATHTGRPEAAELLAGSNDRAYAYSLGILAKMERDPAVKLAAIKGVCRMKLDGCGAYIIGAAGSEDEGLRNGACAAAAGGDAELSDADLLALSEKPCAAAYPEIIAKALRIKYASRPPDGAGELLTFVNDDRAAVRLAGYGALSRLSKDDACPVFAAGLGDADPGVRKLALGELSRRRCSGAAGALAKALEGAAAEERAALIPVVAGLGGPEGLSEVKKYSSEKGLKAEVAAACENAGDADCAVRLYSECLADGLAPRACSAGLARLNSSAAREALLLNVRSAGARAEPVVIRTLAGTGDRAAADELWNLYQNTSDYDLRVTLLSALASMKDSRATEPALALLEAPGHKGEEAVAMARSLADSGERRVLDSLAGLIAKNAVDNQAYFIDLVRQGSGIMDVFTSMKDKAHVGAVVDLSRAIMAADGGYCYCKDDDESCISECETGKSGALKAAAGYLGAAGDPKALPVLGEILRNGEWGAALEAVAAMKDCGAEDPLGEIVKQYKACGDAYCRISVMNAADVFAGARLVRFLSEVYDNEADAGVKDNAARLLDEGSVLRFPKALAGEMRSRDAAARAEAAWAIGALASPRKTVDAPADMIYALYQAGMMAIYRTLGFSADLKPARPEISALAPLLVQALKDRNETVRGNAAGALARFYDGGAEDALSSALRDPSPEVRRRSAEALGNICGATGALSLAVAVKDPAVRVRKAAAESLRFCPAATAGPALIAALDDADPQVVSSALKSLGEMNYRDAASAVIAKAMPGSRWETEAIDALGGIGGAEAVSFLSEMDGRDPKLLQPALSALGRIKDAQASAALRRFAYSQDKEVRAQALDSLGNISVNDNFDDIFGFSLDRDPGIRAKAASLLGQAEGPLVHTASGHLLALLQDKDAEVRSAAMRSLARLKVSYAGRAIIEAMKLGRVPAAEAVDALGEIGDPDALEAMISAKGVDSGDMLRAVAKLRPSDAMPCQLAASCLYFSGAAQRLPAMKAAGSLCPGRNFGRETLMLPSDPAVFMAFFLDDKSADMRREAALALGRMGYPGALPRLADMLATAEGLERTEVMNAISSMSGPEPVKLLAGQIDDKDLMVSVEAVKLLAGMPAQEVPAALLDAFKKGGRDIRMTVMPALGKLKYQPAFDMLLERLSAGDAREKASAACALGLAGDARALEPLKKAALDSDERVRRAAAEAIVSIEQHG